MGVVYQVAFGVVLRLWERYMRRRDFMKVVGGSIIAWPLSARAQQPDRVRRVGVLHMIPEQASLPFTAFRKKFGELGYVEGQNIAFEYRWSDQAQRLRALAAELTGLKVDVILTADTTATFVAKQATNDIPIVAASFAEDPVAAGLVDSLRRPGGNITGISILAPEMSGKRLELLREIVPGLTRVAVLWSREAPYHAALLRETDGAARDLGVVAVPVEGSGDIEGAFQRIIKEHADAVDVLQSVQFFRIGTEIAELGLKYRLPIIAGEDGFVQHGGLIKYGPSVFDNFRQAAVYVDKILKGEKPANLPMSQPSKFELLINLKTAKVLGLTVPPLLLARADEVIE
jgi:putative ABC transport system substrate-binding protein